MPVTPPAEIRPADLAALAPWAVQLAQTFVALAGDVALLVDARGVITHLALGASAVLAPLSRDWIGKPWSDTVTSETRPKIEQMLADTRASGRARARQVNHAVAGEAHAADVPVRYSAVRLGDAGPVLVLGRELAEVSQLQRRFTEAQQETERGYWRTQRSASHHAWLLLAANDGVLRVDAQGVVQAANRAAAALFGRPASVLVGVAAVSLFEPASRPALQSALAASDAGADVPVHALGSPGVARIAVSRRPDGARLLRVRVVDVDPARRHRAYTRLADRSAEAVFVADEEGRLLAANPALLFIAAAAAESELLGRPIGDWLAPEASAAFVERVRADGVVTRAEARLHALDGRVGDVEWSAAVFADGHERFIGATLRRVAAPGAHEQRPATGELHAALERLALGLGRHRLPELLDEAKTLAEQHLIRAAMDRSGGDLDLAAELLGIRRSDLARRSRRTGEPGALRH